MRTAAAIDAENPPWGDVVRVCLGALATFLAFGMLLPIFPIWVRGYSDNLTQVGIATTLAAGVGLVAARPLAARMMEGRTRMPTMALGGFCVGLASALYPFIDGLPPTAHFPAIFTLRAIQGLGFGLVTTAAVSAITDLTPLHRRGEIIGYFAASNALALIIGPLIGGGLEKLLDIEVAFWVAGGLAIPSLYFMALVREPGPAPLPPGSFKLLDAFRFPALRIVVIGHFAAVILHGALLAFGPLMLDAREGWMSVEVFFAIEAAAIIAFRIGVGRKFDLYDRLHFVRGGLALLVVGGLLLGTVQNDFLLILTAIIYGLGFGAYVPTMNALVGDIIPGSHRARGFALFMLAFDIAIAAGGAIVGPVADRADPQTALLVAAAFPAIALGVYVWGTRRLRIEMSRR